MEEDIEELKTMVKVSSTAPSKKTNRGKTFYAKGSRKHNR